MWWHTGKWRGNWRMEWVSNTLHTTSEHDVSSITTADAHTSAASSRLNWRPRRFKWTRPFRRKTKSGFCACAVTFQRQSTNVYVLRNSDRDIFCTSFYLVRCCLLAWRPCRSLLTEEARNTKWDQGISYWRYMKMTAVRGIGRMSPLPLRYLCKFRQFIHIY
jgi:hypothetical protein